MGRHAGPMQLFGQSSLKLFLVWRDWFLLQPICLHHSLERWPLTEDYWWEFIAQWESGIYANHQCNVFKRNEAIIIHLACTAFLSPQKGKGLQCRHEAFFACKGQFAGINTVCFDCDLASEVIQKMRYEGVSQSWNWGKHCAKFHQGIWVINEWAMAGMVVHMSNKDHISA